MIRAGCRLERKQKLKEKGGTKKEKINLKSYATIYVYIHIYIYIYEGLKLKLQNIIKIINGSHHQIHP